MTSVASLPPGDDPAAGAAAVVIGSDADGGATGPGSAVGSAVAGVALAGSRGGSPAGARALVGGAVPSGFGSGVPAPGCGPIGSVCVCLAAGTLSHKLRVVVCVTT